ncbi:MAG: MerR family transcriptional regulator [Patulibacter minatonensis]
MSTATDHVPTGATSPAADAAATISAIEMSRLSGVGRERLRTWERRHGFPTPLRTANGMRRYYAEDVRRVLAVARMVENGSPLADAIQMCLGADAEGASVESLGSVLDDAPIPAIALRGSSPLTVAWASRATIMAPEAISVGDDLLHAVPNFGAVAVSRIQQLLVGDDSQAAVIEHGDWVGAFPASRRSLAWRVAPTASGEPMVVLMQLADEQVVEQPFTLQSSRLATWMGALRDAGDVLREQGGVASVQRAVAQLVRSTGAMDGFIGTCRGEDLRSASSVRGVFPSRSIPLEPGGDVLTALGEGSFAWLGARTRRQLKTPTRSRILIVPMQAGGSVVGGLFLVYPDELELCEVTKELLRGFATSLAITLQRESLSQRSDAGLRGGGMTFRRHRVRR